MAVAALLLSWTMLIQPVLANADMPMALRVVNGTYPTLSVAVLFVGALIAMSEARSIPAFWGLLLAWVALLTGDLVYALASVGTSTLPLWWPIALTAPALACWALPRYTRRWCRSAGRRPSQFEATGTAGSSPSR